MKRNDQGYYIDEKKKMIQFWILITIGTISGLISVIMVGRILTTQNTVAQTGFTIDELSERNRRLEENLTNLEHQINMLDFQHTYSDTGTLMTKKQIEQLALVSQDISHLKESDKVLSQYILDNPAKAVAMPLLKQQIEMQNEQYRGEFQALREEFARVYDMLKWIVGLVITMFVSLMVVVIGSILSKPKEPKRSEKPF